MKNKHNFIIILLMILLASVPASANSALTHWSGSETGSSVFLEEDCPIVVDHEILTFSVDSLPQDYYRDMTDFYSYHASVTAEYEFRNPSAETVKATLAFPFGKAPMYQPGLNFSVPLHEEPIRINSEPIPYTLRYTFQPKENFSLSEDLDMLKRTSPSDAFFREDQKVTVYTYRVTEGLTEDWYDIQATHSFSMDSERTRIIFLPDIAVSVTPEEVVAETAMMQDAEFKVCIVGEDTIGEVEWDFQKNEDSKTQAEVKLELIGRETTSLHDFVMSYYGTPLGMTESDYYIISCEYMKAFSENGMLLHFSTVPESRYLMRWFEYDIELSPGETIRNAVTAPIYPSIDLSYDPAVYEYTYLLSPASSWAEFRGLDIQVNTDLKLVKSSLDGFKTNENGYAASFDKLPEKELTFTLSASEKPEKDRTVSTIIIVILAAIALLTLLLLIFIIKLILKIARRKRK